MKTEDIIGWVVAVLFVGSIIGAAIISTYYKTPTDCFEEEAREYCRKNYKKSYLEYELNGHDSFQCRTDNGRTNMVSFSEDFYFLEREIKYCNSMWKEDFVKEEKKE